MRMNRDLVVVGAGGHAKVVIATARAAGYSVLVAYDDDRSLDGSRILDVPIRTPIAAIKDSGAENVVLAIGQNGARKRLSELQGYSWKTVIHPSAFIDSTAEVGDGSVVFANAVVQACSKVGRHSILNTGCTVDHDCVIGNFVHLAPGCHLAGCVRVDTGAFLGIGSAVIVGKWIGEWAVVGAGGVVIDDVAPRSQAIGVPARPRRNPE